MKPPRRSTASPAEVSKARKLRLAHVHRILHKLRVSGGVVGVRFW